MDVFDLLFFIPAILFVIASWSPTTVETAPTVKPQRFFGLPRSSLAWASILIATGFFVFMRLFWMQAGSPGRDRSTFFSDPINAGCLIGAFGAPIVGMVLTLVAIIWKRERSWMLIPVILLGVFSLLWALGILFGNL